MDYVNWKKKSNNLTQNPATFRLVAQCPPIFDNRFKIRTKHFKHFLHFGRHDKSYHASLLGNRRMELDTSLSWRTNYSIFLPPGWLADRSSTIGLPTHPPFAHSPLNHSQVTTSGVKSPVSTTALNQLKTSRHRPASLWFIQFRTLVGLPNELPPIDTQYYHICPLLLTLHHRNCSRKSLNYPTLIGKWTILHGPKQTFL
jgi:hypothetical protein